MYVLCSAVLSVSGWHKHFCLSFYHIQVAQHRESTYWCPVDTEKGIYEQLKEKQFPEIVDKLVSLENKLGEGEFGEVYRGLWKVAGQGNPMEVAVKVPKGNSDENRIRVLQEAAILGQFNHPRVTRLCGIVTLGNPVSASLANTWRWCLCLQSIRIANAKVGHICTLKPV